MGWLLKEMSRKADSPAAIPTTDRRASGSAHDVSPVLILGLAGLGPLYEDGLDHDRFLGGRPFDVHAQNHSR